MNRAHIGRPQTWNQYFKADLDKFCDKHAITISKQAIGILWLVAISGKPKYWGDLITKGVHFDFFQIYCAAPDDTLAVLGKMRQLDGALSRAKRVVLCRDTAGLSHDAAAALAKGKLTGKQIGEAHEQISKKQKRDIPTRKKHSE